MRVQNIASRSGRIAAKNVGGCNGIHGCVALLTLQAERVHKRAEEMRAGYAQRDTLLTCMEVHSTSSADRFEQCTTGATGAGAAASSHDYNNLMHDVPDHDAAMWCCERGGPALSPSTEEPSLPYRSAHLLKKSACSVNTGKPIRHSGARLEGDGARAQLGYLLDGPDAEN